ncbi:hypothetical protein [uncultured Streptococcus sp.]|uniref:hypothetical protein n=1 Tax=uncultured Streptococcus sp. TaxID=83427 RepID=UPI00258A3F0C|nr:hypothetical protein [uncultured Streptococcus sp.]
MARCFERVLQTGSEIGTREKVLLFSLLVDILIVLYSLRCWGRISVPEGKREIEVSYHFTIWEKIFFSLSLVYDIFEAFYGYIVLKKNNILVLSTNKSVRIQFFRKGRYDLFCVLVNRYVGFSLFKKSIV